jgi:hypothetical protein
VLNAETTQPVADATIEIITNNSTQTASSDETGYFDLGKYTIGDYTIIISKDGFSTQTQQIFAADNASGSGKSDYYSVDLELVSASGMQEYNNTIDFVTAE